MTDELIRLCDLLPMYSNYHGVSLPEAAFGLHELMDEAFLAYLGRGEELLPERLFWVGGVSSSKRSVRGYVLGHEGLIKYFKALSEPSGSTQFINCFCHAEYDYVNVPASIVYSSKTALSEWLKNAGVSDFSFVLDVGVSSKECGSSSVISSKELNSISLIINGLVELIKEVDKAHTVQGIDAAAQIRADAIKRRALGVRSVRKNFNPCMAILSLADAAQVEMPKSHKTLGKFMKGHIQSDMEQST